MRMLEGLVETREPDSDGEEQSKQGRMRDTNTAWRQETARERQQRLDSIEIGSSHQIDLNSFETLLTEDEKGRNRSLDPKPPAWDQSRTFEQKDQS